MRFEKKYPLSLNELLLAPVVFRAGLPALADCPLASAAGMRDLAEFSGYAPGAIRTAMSRLRTSGLVDTFLDPGGVTRYQLAGLARSIRHTVVERPSRPDGLLLAVFSFSSEDARERQVVREALKLHGFQKLAQNVYINGQIDTAELEAQFDREGLSDHVYFFRSQTAGEPSLQKKLASLFDLARRMQALLQFERDLSGFLEEPRLDDATFSRRYLYSGPVHYRITFTDEPPLPATSLPAGYPLERLHSLMASLAKRRADALARYFRAVHA